MIHRSLFDGSAESGEQIVYRQILQYAVYPFNTSDASQDVSDSEVCRYNATIFQVPDGETVTMDVDDNKIR